MCAEHEHAREVSCNLQGRPDKKCLHNTVSSWWPSDSPCQSRQTGDLTGFLDATACTAENMPDLDLQLRAFVSLSLDLAS